MFWDVWKKNKSSISDGNFDQNSSLRSGLGWVELGTARLGSARLGSGRVGGFGSVRLGLVRLGSVEGRGREGAKAG